MVTLKWRFDRRLYSQKGYHNFANIWFGLVWLVWFDLLVVTVEKVFDLMWKKAYGINSEHSIRKHYRKFTLWFISLFLKSRVRRFSSYTPRKTKKIPPNHHESTYFYRFSKWRASRPVHLQSTDINLLVSVPYLKLFCINF